MFSRVTFKTSSIKEEDEDTDPNLLKKNVTIRDDIAFTRDYKVGEYLGSGKFGEVKRCEEIHTGKEFAAKFVPIACNEDWESVQNEVAIMNKLRHPRLIQLYDAYAMKTEVVLVLELITGGELFERIIDEDFDLNESRCIRFMSEILQGVEYIHNQGVLHLDLKPENILCLSKTSFKIKIIDFGLARLYGGAEVCVLFGTPEFVSPEVISYEPVTPAADMWSVGVICYVMLSGLSPFMGDSQGETLANIMRVKYDFDYQEFEEISEGARDFIRKLLVKDPRKRMTASDCLQHSWIKRKKQLKRKGTVSKKRLKHFVYRRKWQKAVNAIIALIRMGVVLQHPQLEWQQPGQPSSVVNNPAASQEPASKPSTIAPAATTSSKPVDSIDSSKRPKIEDKAVSAVKTKDRRMSFKAMNNAIFGKFASKRSPPEQPESPRPSSSTTRRPSILSRLTKRDESSQAADSNLTKTKQSDSSLKSKLNFVRKSSREEGNSLQYQSSSKKQPKEKSSGVSSPEAPINSQPSTGGLEKNVNNDLENPEQQVNKSEQTSKTKIPTTPQVKATENNSGVQSSISSDKAAIPQSSISPQPDKTSKPAQLKDNLKPVKPSPTSRKIAPVTGGIAAKIGFFNNIPKDNTPRAKNI